MIHAYAARQAGTTLEPFEYDPGALRDQEVVIAVECCGVCHSDLSMLKNDWGISTYPLIPGHEVVGTIAAVGSRVTMVAVGQRPRGVGHPPCPAGSITPRWARSSAAASPCSTRSCKLMCGPPTGWG